MLESADPTASPLVSPSLEHKVTYSAKARHQGTSTPPLTYNAAKKNAPMIERATSWSGVLRRQGSSTSSQGLTTPTNGVTTNGTGQTRLQATFQAIKYMSSGLGSPRLNFSPDKRVASGDKSPGYFGGEVEEVEEEGS